MSGAATDYYNDHDAGACAWLRELIADGLVPPGDVDEHDVTTLVPDVLRGYRRVHLFAGIGGWAEALRLAGWPDDRPVWTGSCPCQPFSAAGKGKGEADSRHLWPAFLALIRECRPDCVFGEQVASAAGYRWLDGVRTDLEQEGYALGAADLPAACVGAPHIRQRLFWVATRHGASDAASVRRGERQHPGSVVRPAGTQPEHEPFIQPDRVVGDGSTRHPPHPGRASLRHERQPLPGASGGNQGQGHQRQWLRPDAGDGGEPGRSCDAKGERERPGADGACGDGTGGLGVAGPGARGDAFNGGAVGLPPDARHGERGRQGEQRPRGEEATERHQETDKPLGLLPDGGFWDDYDIIHYRDGKARRVEPGTFPLADGIPPELVGVWAACFPGTPPPQGKFPGRVGILRGYGNAIVPAVAAVFIRAFLESEREDLHGLR